jgi:hypothetical protein
MGFRVIEPLLNKKIVNFEYDDVSLKLYTEDGYFKFYHEQSCCESVWLEDICGDLTDLKGEVLLTAEVVSNYEDDPPSNPDYGVDDSYTWTYYKLGSIKGTVTLRFFGTSNGYYSESISISFIDKKGKKTVCDRSWD